MNRYSLDEAIRKKQKTIMQYEKKISELMRDIDTIVYIQNREDELDRLIQKANEIIKEDE